YYNEGLSDLPQVTLPYRADYSSHVYHQYTVQVPAEYRDSLKKYLESRGIPSMIYYPLPLHGQKAFKGIARLSGSLETAGRLAASVLSLPMHTELTRDVQDEVIYAVKEFFRTNG
ncbi:MAG TPA: DegT/DnrJ/EryC1/StrS family aminotransferase, partial [Candidatus Coprenecus stercoripullorum]|nr:DegT/DnrJ/EryC1/StrS family aminotransferase [Candidatus Coprenecus stercoripullorum]